MGEFLRLNGCTRAGYGVEIQEGGAKIIQFKLKVKVAVLSENGIEFVFHCKRLVQRIERRIVAM